jgi:hypothetical protein
VNADFAVAPEIAQLATALVAVSHGTAAPRTDGRVAGDLADLAATPQGWWDLVRFDPDGPVRIPVPGAPGTWLLVLPPGAAADCDCRQATALAGEAVEAAAGIAGGPPRANPEPPGADQTSAHQPSAAPAGRPLRPGRVRVHGAGLPHRLRAVGPGYSVTLHAR